TGKTARKKKPAGESRAFFRRSDANGCCLLVGCDDAALVVQLTAALNGDDRREYVAPAPAPNHEAPPGARLVRLRVHHGQQKTKQRGERVDASKNCDRRKVDERENRPCHKAEDEETKPTGYLESKHGDRMPRSARANYQ